MTVSVASISPTITAVEPPKVVVPVAAVEASGAVSPVTVVVVVDVVAVAVVIAATAQQGLFRVQDVALRLNDPARKV